MCASLWNSSERRESKSKSESESDFGEEEDSDKELGEKKEKESLLELLPPLDDTDPRVMVAGGPTLKVRKVKVKMEVKSKKQVKTEVVAAWAPSSTG